MKSSIKTLTLTFSIILLLACSNGQKKSSTAQFNPVASSDSVKIGKFLAFAFTKDCTRVDLKALRAAKGFTVPTPEALKVFNAKKNRWRPARNFGPFLSGSDFEQIRIAIPVNSATPVMYFNNFDASLGATVRPTYQLYWHPQIPTNSSASLDLRSVMLTSLKRIEYSSRFGGTVKLIFRYSEMQGFDGPWAQGQPSLPLDATFTPEDYGIDMTVKPYNQTWYSFDIGDLQLDVYLSLLNTTFNPTAALTIAGGQMYCEIQTHDIVAYKYSTVDRLPLHIIKPGTAEFQTAMGHFRSRIEAIRTELVKNATNYGSFGDKFLRIAYSFVHDQFYMEFNQGTSPIPRKVKTLYIADNFMDLTTRPGIPYFSISFNGSASGPCFSCDGLSSTPDLRFHFLITQVNSDGSIGSRQSTNIDFEEDDYQDLGDTPGYYHMYVNTQRVPGPIVYLEQCDMVNRIECTLSVIDRDSGLTFGDDVLSTLHLEFQPDCAQLQTRANNNQWGSVPWVYLSDHDDEPIAGQALSTSLSARVRLDVR
jgi:hypothetical protein